MRRRSRYGWLELIEGILLILLGVITLFRPGNVLKGVTIIYGIMAVVTGISDIVFYAKTERYMGFGPTVALVSGILSILTGLMLLMYPNAGELVLVLLLPIWFIAHSISRLTHLPLVRRLAGNFLPDPAGNRQYCNGMQRYGHRVDVKEKIQLYKTASEARKHALEEDAIYDFNL